jgi:hypothetical protein
MSSSTRFGLTRPGFRQVAIVLLAACYSSRTAEALGSDGFLDVRLANGQLSASVPPGGTYDIVVAVRAAPTVSFNAALFVLFSTRESVQITDYEWAPPFVTRGFGDFSLDGAPLPLLVTNETHVAPKLPPDLADVEFGVFDLLDAGEPGDLLRVSMKAPLDAKVGSEYFMATIPDLFTLGFAEVALSPGTAVRIEIVEPIAGDLNGDGIVASADLAILLAAWGGGGAADINGDGVVDANDLGELLAAWME